MTRMNNETDGTAHMIYADNAATTKLSSSALEAMTPYFAEQYGNPSSLHSLGQNAAGALLKARQTVAECLNASPGEITFTSGGTEANNQAILTAVAAGAKKGRNHVVTTAFEHHAVLHAVKKLEKNGLEVTWLEVGSDGMVEAEAVRDAISEKTALVAVMFANNEIGTVQPIAEIGAVCREKGVPFFTDAVQAAGHLPIDVKQQSIDMLSLSAHKFHGPKGVGALYARRGIRPTNLLEGGAQERGVRPGTENIPAIVGMAAALKDACDRQGEVSVRVSAMRDRLIEQLTQIPHAVLNGDRDRRLPGIVNLCFEGIEGESLLLLLDQKGICASSGSACTSGSLDPSHVLLALGLPHEVAHGSLRLSISEYNTDEEITHILASVPGVVGYLRSISPIWDDLQKGLREHII